MSADDVYRSYINICEECMVEPTSLIIDAIKCNSGKEHGILNLSTHSFATGICYVLGKLLSRDVFFHEIYFNDCMLSTDALNVIIQGLIKNTTCKKLEIKGNNIHAQNAEIIGSLLKHNTSIGSISLEWNSMGMLISSFRLFCDALVSNKILQKLDLRNNQITHDCAIVLADALKLNKYLKYLDLRWNSIGIIGGKSILEMLEVNKNIVILELSGNNIPNDILHSINSAIQHSYDRNQLKVDYTERQKMLTNRLHESEMDRKSEVSKLLEKLDKQDISINTLNSSHQSRIKSLKDTLHDRKSQFVNLSTKLALLQSELGLSNSENLELKTLVKEIESNAQERSHQHLSELRKMQEQNGVTEAKLNKEIFEKTEHNIILQNKLDESERKVKTQRDQIYEQKELLSLMQANEKMKASQHEERLAYEKQKLKEFELENNEKWRKDVNHAKKESQDQNSIYKERINKMDSGRIQLEEEINNLKTAVNTEKLNAEENLMSVKQHCKMEEEMRQNQMQEKLRMVQNTRDELKSQCSQYIANISDLQNENASLNMESDSLKHRIDDLNNKLNDKNNNIMTEVNKVRLEMSSKIDKLEAERKTKEELYDKIDEFQKQIGQIEGKYKNDMSTKDIEILKLNETIKARDAEIKHIHNADIQRTSMLQSAVMSYITQTPYPNS